MEYWDIYDRDKKPTGYLMRRNDWILKDGEYHLSVLGVIRRHDGKFLITKRKLDKAWAPGWWEVSGGGVQAGETSREAVVREVREETGLDVSGCRGGFAFDYHRENPGEGDNYFVDVYIFCLDFDLDDVVLQLAEATDCRAVTADEIKALADQGIFLHYDSIKKIFDDDTFMKVTGETIRLSGEAAQVHRSEISDLSCSACADVPLEPEGKEKAMADASDEISSESFSSACSHETPEYDQGRLQEQLDFLLEIDKEKFITRRTYLSDGKRLENDAEHGWHAAIMAYVLREYSNSKTDVLRTVMMLLIHDLVEIYAGDTYAYDPEGQKSAHERELAAADRLYSILPEDQAKELHALWDEFEARETPESKFAHTMDNLQPLMLNIASRGRSWTEHGIKLSQPLKRNEKTAEGSKILWDYALNHYLRQGVENGWLIDDSDRKKQGL